MQGVPALVLALGALSVVSSLCYDTYTCGSTCPINFCKNGECFDGITCDREGTYCDEAGQAVCEDCVAGCCGTWCDAPTPSPTPFTAEPTPQTWAPTGRPSKVPSPMPSETPSELPSPVPSYTEEPTLPPSIVPTHSPTDPPSPAPTDVPVFPPTPAPTPYPTRTETPTTKDYRERGDSIGFLTTQAARLSLGAVVLFLILVCVLFNVQSCFGDPGRNETLGAWLIGELCGRSPEVGKMRGYSNDTAATSNVTSPFYGQQGSGGGGRGEPDVLLTVQHAQVETTEEGGAGRLSSFSQEKKPMRDSHEGSARGSDQQTVLV